MEAILGVSRARAGKDDRIFIFSFKTCLCYYKEYSILEGNKPGVHRYYSLPIIIY